MKYQTLRLLIKQHEETIKILQLKLNILLNAIHADEGLHTGEVGQEQSYDDALKIIDTFRFKGDGDETL